MSREVPGEWVSTTLGELTQISGGTTPSREVGEFWEDGQHFWATPTDITALPPGKVELSSTKTMVSDAALQRTSLKMLPVGSVLMTSRATIGYPAINTVPVATNQGFANFHPSAKYDAAFLAYWIVFSRKSLERSAGGSTFPEISKAALKSIPINLPPLHEQRRIAEILSSVDEAIAATRAVIEQTRKVKQVTLERLLTKGIGHTRFKQTEIGEIPEEWEVVRLNHIAERTTYGFTNPMSTVEDGPWGKINYRSARRTDRVEFETLLSEKSKPAENTVLITKDGTLGRVAIVDRGDLCINQSVAAVTPNESRIMPRFLYWLLQSASVQTRILAEAGGSTIKHIYISKLAETVLQLPPLNEQEEIVRNIDLVELSLEREHSHFGAMIAFKTALMSDLLTGRKRVTDALPMAAE